VSTIFNIRNLKLPNVSRATTLMATVVITLALVAGVVGWQLYRRLVFNTVVAYFPSTTALYAGDSVQIMGVQVGQIDAIEPAGDKTKVTFRYRNKYRVPADVTASIINPSLVASREIQLSPSYTNGPVLQDNAVIPIERSQVPVEWDELRNQVNRLVEGLGPTGEQPNGPLADLINSFSTGLAGKGGQINDTLTALAEAVTTLNDGRGDFFAIVRSLALFVNALHQSDQQLVELNGNLAKFTDSFTHGDHELADTLQALDRLLPTVRTFIADNGSVLAHDINNLATTTTALMQPEPRNGLETALHVLPNSAANFANIYQPAHGAVAAEMAISSFANPMQALCSIIQAGSRLGYQESAELCAQYLAPILDAVKFNHMPFGMNPLVTAMLLPKNVAYSEDRLHPPPGYKDTTVPGIWSRDTLLSHGNHEPGWVVAPGMQGVDVQPSTASMLTPDSLAELMGGPDIAPPPAGTTLPGPPNAYDQTNPLPPPWYPQPAPPPGAAPGDPLTAIAPTATSGSPLPAEAGTR
jgi:phospholipid/cholesterol/gamma-HCH transport system substrate-binding protein